MKTLVEVALGNMKTEVKVTVTKIRTLFSEFA